MLSKVSLNLKLKEIAAVLEVRGDESPDVGVLGGTSGVAMFFFYYAKYRNDSRYTEIGYQLLKKSVEILSNEYSLATYCSGIAGASWVFEHLSQEGLIEVDNDHLLPEIDAYLHQKMEYELQRGHYDFLHGAIGYGLYFLKRFGNTKSPSLRKQYESYLKELLQGLKDIAEEDASGLKWPSQITINDESQKAYNLSLSHGISSVINFLTRICKYKELTKEGLPLLEGAVGYLLSQEHPVGDCLFPSTVPAKAGIKSEESRLAWCYGDLGLGMSLFNASKILGDSALAQNAIRILKYTERRKGAVACNVVDASPCHGAFGIAHIYSTIFKETQITSFKESADYWMREGLAMGVDKHGYAGYRQFRMDKPWTNEISVLEGIAGIGLVIISYLADFDANWGESLLID